jgi:hypothetical protein
MDNVCPLLKQQCLKSGCALWTDQCAISQIALELRQISSRDIRVYNFLYDT